MKLAPTLRLSLLAASLMLAGPVLADDAPATGTAAAPATTTAPATDTTAAPATDATAAPAAGSDAAAAPPPPSIEATAPTQSDPDAVVATVDGDPITQLDLAVAEPTLHDALAQVPQDQQYTELLKAVINIRLMAKQAVTAGLDKTKENAALLAFTAQRTLRYLYLQDKMAAIDDAAVKAAYDAEVAKFVPEDQIHAEHILVSSEAEAKDIIAQLDKGANFEDLAKSKSSDTASGVSGGDLGWFSKGQMVKPFEDAAFALDVGKYTETPVQSQFGWHVIKVLEKRKSTPPALADRESDIRNNLEQQLYISETSRLFAAAKVVVIQPDTAAAPAAPAPAAPADTGAAPAPTDSGAATAPATGGTATAPAQ